MEEVTTRGLYGRASYSRRPEGAGRTLVVPFQNGTFEVKDSLRELGFRCKYEERLWELEAGQYSEYKERQLRYLLDQGVLPPAGARLESFRPPPPAGAAEGTSAAPGASPAAAGRAADVTATPNQRAERKRPWKEEGGDAEAADEEEPAWQQRFHSDQCAVTLRREAGGYYVLEGVALRNIAPMLQRILRFTCLPPAPGQPPRWRSSFPLTDAEREFVAAVVEHRRRKLAEGGRFDDLEPIPPGTVVPARFRPRTDEGLAMRGPWKVRHGGNGMQHNWGRQFFSGSNNSGFLWADGTEAFSQEAGDRFLGWAVDGGHDAVLYHPDGVTLAIGGMVLPFGAA